MTSLNFTITKFFPVYRETEAQRNLKSPMPTCRWGQDWNPGRPVPKRGPLPQTSQPGAETEGPGILWAPSKPRATKLQGLAGELADIVPLQGSLLLNPLEG